MTLRRRALLAATTGLALLEVLLPVAHAQDAWPARPVRIVVPFAPGGSADSAARLLAPKLSEKLGRPVLIDNRPGAGGSLAIGQVVKAPADGYTVLLAAAGGLTISPGLNPNIGYEPLGDLAPITGFARIPFVLVTNGDLGIPRIGDLIRHVRGNPGKFSYATGGNGTAMHIGGEMFKAMSQSYIVHVPYRGSGPAAVAAMSGEVQMAVVDFASVIGQRDNPKLKLMATLGKERSTLLPDLPTLHESGLAGYDVTGWFGLFAPARTPLPIVSRLNTEIVALLRTPEFAERFRNLGMEPQPTTSDELRTLMRNEIAAYSAVIKRAGIKLE
ncbi:MAG: tripartite tricarboxylate transporter substrate binding protein [Ramlibacter sp.]|nr:tripartite tricarboxylate transporter substrate binding protein [Ramlibacter sp.]